MILDWFRAHIMSDYLLRLTTMRANVIEKKHRPDVILHIGAPKTGTSAIQRLSVQSRRTLFRYGYLYPQHILDINGISSGHVFLANSLKVDDLRRTHDQIHQLVEKSKRLNSTLLLSSEGFFRFPEKLHEILKGYDVRVVAWFRHPIDSFISNYNQGVKRHFFTMELIEKCKEFLRGKSDFYLSGSTLFKWGGLFGDESCTFNPYLSTNAGNIECEWAGLLGLPSDALLVKGIRPTVNRSYVTDALELKRLLNHVLSPEHVKICSNIDQFFQRYSEQTGQPGKVASELLSQDIIEQLYDRFHPQLQQLSSRFPSLRPLIDMRFQSSLDSGLPERTEVSNLWFSLCSTHPGILSFVAREVQNKRRLGMRDSALDDLAELLARTDL